MVGRQPLFVCFPAQNRLLLYSIATRGLVLTALLLALPQIINVGRLRRLTVLCHSLAAAADLVESGRRDDFAGRRRGQCAPRLARRGWRCAGGGGGDGRRRRQHGWWRRCRRVAPAVECPPRMVRSDGWIAQGGLAARRRARRTLCPEFLSADDHRAANARTCTAPPSMAHFE